MIVSRRNQTIVLALIGLLLFCTPAIAAETVITRSIIPAIPQPGGLANVTLTLPHPFYGGIIEQLPGGFTFEETGHLVNGVQQNGQTIIFAITGEETIWYTIRAPSTGCGVIQGMWEDIREKTSGKTLSTEILVAGTEPSTCAKSPHTSGFTALTVTAAGIIVAFVFFLREVKQ